MKRCLIYAGFVAVVLSGGFDGALPIAEAQVAVPPPIRTVSRRNKCGECVCDGITAIIGSERNPLRHHR